MPNRIQYVVSMIAILRHQEDHVPQSDIEPRQEFNHRLEIMKIAARHDRIDLYGQLLLMTLSYDVGRSAVRSGNARTSIMQRCGRSMQPESNSHQPARLQLADNRIFEHCRRKQSQ